VVENERLASLGGRTFLIECETKTGSVFVDFLNLSFGGRERSLREGRESNRLALDFQSLLLSVIKLVDSGNEVFLSDGNNGVHEVKASEVGEVVYVPKENSVMFSLIVDSNDVFWSFLAPDDVVLLGDNSG
jgi:hypothetical protein